MFYVINCFCSKKIKILCVMFNLFRIIKDRYIVDWKNNVNYVLFMRYIDLKLV